VSICHRNEVVRVGVSGCHGPDKIRDETRREGEERIEEGRGERGEERRGERRRRDETRRDKKRRELYYDWCTVNAECLPTQR
jgi:hypothetical protein